MATGRKKCICQICTCGKHICPHRKKATLSLKDNGNGDSAGAARYRLRNGEQAGGRRMSLDKTQRTARVSKPGSSEKVGNGESATERRESAVIVQDKGNAVVDKTWSAKQVPKTLAIKPPDNLKPEGPLDLTTTHQQDFTEKRREASGTSDHGQETKAFDYDKDSWNRRQIPKTLPIRKEDNLKTSGLMPQDDQSVQFAEPSAVQESVRDDERSVSERAVQKEKRQRPTTSLKPEGPFESETLYQKDFTPRPAEQSPKATPRPPNNLKPEGPMFFDTTSLDYSVLKKTEEEQENSIRPKKHRPQSQLKIPPVPLAADTTVAADFKRWNVERPPRRRPHDNLKRLGKSDSKDENDLLSLLRNDTYHEDFKQWQVRRPVVRKPESNLKPEGEIAFVTTHTADYIPKRPEPTTADEPSRETDVLGEPTEIRSPVEHTADSHAQEKEIREEPRPISPPSQPVSPPRTPPETETSGAALVETLAGAQKEDFQHTEAGKGEEIREPEVAEVLQDDDVASDTGQYLTWDQIRPKPIRPHSNLRQQGSMEFTTTNRSEFVRRPFDRVKGFRPTTTTKLSGDLVTTTTNQSMFGETTAEKVLPIRPKSNLHLEDGTFAGETTFAREFKPWAIDKPHPITHKSTLAQEGSMEFTTTNHVEFEPKFSEKVSPVRPKTTNRVYDKDGMFEGMTTSRFMHPGYAPERMDPIKPETNLKPSSGSFSDETTTRREFQEWKFDRPTPVRPSTNMKQEGEMDFTTMNQVQFQEKTAEPVTQIRPHTSSKITGDFDGTTVNQVMFKPLPIEKMRQIVPRPNLFVESGRFEGDTTTRREYQPWKQEKPKPFTPRNSLALTSEGEHDFTTTSQVQFGEKIAEKVYMVKPHSSSRLTGPFDGTTTNREMYKHIPTPRQGDLRPQTHLQLEGGNFSNGTTARDSYQEWELAKQGLIKPRSSIRPEGEMEFSTTNRAEFDGKPQERVSGIRPTTSTKITGEFDGTTTNQVMFQNLQSHKQAPIRPQTNLHLEDGTFAEETTTRKEYQKWIQERQRPVRPQENLIREGDMEFMTSNKADFGQKKIERVKQIRPQSAEHVTGNFEGMTTNRSSYTTPPLDRYQALRLAQDQRSGVDVSAPFQGETTTNNDFVYRYYERPTPVRPKPNLHQEGELDFTTSNQLEFGPKPIEKPHPIKPQTATRLPGGEFYGTTTNQAMFKESEVEKAKPIRPHTNLRPQGGHFYGNTTARDEFQGWKTDRPAPVVYSDTLKQEGSMQFETTNRSEFTERSTDRPNPVRPKTTNKMEGDMDITTTNQVMFPTYASERVKPIRQKDNLHLETGKFNDETTSRREFRQWVKEHGKVDKKLVKELKAAGVPTQKQPSLEEEEEAKDTAKEINGNGGQVEEAEEDAVKPPSVQSEPETKETRIDSTRADETEPPEEAVDVAPVGQGRKASDGTIKVPIDSEAKPTESGEEHKTAVDSAAAEENVADKPASGPWKLASGEIYDNGKTRNGSYRVDRERSLPRPAAPTVRPIKRYRPSDNLKPENVPFDGESTTRLEYRRWNEASRSSPKKRPSALKQEGEMIFSTTTEDYSRRDVKDDVIKQLAATRNRKPQENLKQVGEMEFSTTTHSTYAGNAIPKTKTLRPRSTLRIGVADTTSGTERSSPKEKQTDLTTTMAAYKGYVGSKTRANRPSTSQKVGEGQFEGKTTTQSAFGVLPLDKVEKPKPFKPEKSIVFNGDEGFQGNTTYRCSFEAMKAKQCPVLDLEGNPNYKCKEEVNGHIYFLPLVTETT